MKDFREWQVNKNGHLWSDRFNSEELAIEHMEECIREDPGSEFEVQEMTQEEIDVYNRG